MSLQDLARAAGISAEDEELLALLLAEEGVELAASTGIPHVAGRSEAPLSFAQERLWFLDRLAPGGSAYNVPSAVRLTGNLRLAVLVRVWREILRRHDSLRTRFAMRDGVPLQVIDAQPTRGSEMVVADLSALHEAAKRATEKQLVRWSSSQPFDLEHGPVARALLLRLGSLPAEAPGAAAGQTENVLVVTLHHIVSDGWSMGVLVREVGALYAAFAQGKPSPLPEPEIQYPDFSEWQRQYLSGEVLEAELAYWRQRLQGAPVLGLMTDRPRPPMPTYQGDVVSLRFGPELTGGLKALTDAQGATTFMTFLAALDVLFSRYTGQEDIVLGSMIANRNRPEIEGLIGFFINALTLRTDVSGDPTFRQLLDRVREVALGAFAHQDLPFEKLVAEVQPGRDLSRSPLFQVAFLVQNMPTSSLELPELRLGIVEGEMKIAKFDLQITLSEGADRIQGSLNYSTDLFEEATIVRLRGHLETLLAGIVAFPDRPISQLPILPDAEREQVLVEWNATGPAPAAGYCLHELFAAQVARTPGATALIDGERRWSYAELDAWTNRLARHLRGLGVGPETRVGVCLERSGRMVAALLGILKAGGAYVGLDPKYPQDRLAFMLADAAALAVITEESLLSILPEHAAAVVRLDDETLLAETPDTALSRAASGASPDHLAYLIYTSGSTGRPKGVAIEHASAAAMVGWATAFYPREVLAGVLASTSICFDLSVFEIFVPLSMGGAVVVAENALALPSLPAAGEVTLVNTVPSAIAGLVRLGPLPARAATINLAGEALKRELVEEIYRQPTVRQVWNLYGPSEDTTYSTWAAARAGAEKPPAIGKPLSGSRAYLLDSRGGPVPLGAPGELYLAGAGLARGYLGRPDLTADRFVPDPFAAGGSAGGERLYRTGDLARYRVEGADGELDYLGRIDHQVKVRGFRIELGEIETALLAQGELAEAVVLAREDAGTGLRLVGYVVAKEGVAATSPDALADRLRAALLDGLPEYMVPAAFVVLPAMPLTANGKIDRRALPAPDAVAPGEKVAVAPRDAAERFVGRLWAETLGLAGGLDAVSVEDDFFALGGNSITSAVLVNRLQQALGETVPVIAVFKARTVAGLTALLAAEHGEALARAARAGGTDGAPAADSAAFNIEKRPWHAGDSAVLSYAQERLWFLDQLDPGRSTYNLPFALRLTGRLDVPALAGAVSEIVRRHATLRTTFATREAGPVQVIGPAVPAVPPITDLSGLPAAVREAEAKRLAAAEARRPFDLAHGPVLRVRLLRLALGDSGSGSGEAGEHIAFFNMHHIASDGWSMGVLVHELVALYSAALDRAVSPLPALPIQYADYAVWQRGWLTGEVLAGRIAYWRQALAGVPVLQLPTDRPRPAVASFQGGTLPFAVAPEVAAALTAIGRPHGMSLFMLLLAAFQAFLARWAGQEDFAVGSPVANRTRAEVEGLIGFFVNTLVLRADLTGTPSFAELALRVRETALGAYAHQELPFEKVVEELQPERDLARTPLFQVMLILQNNRSEELRLPGLALAPVRADLAGAKFELTLALGERGERPGGAQGGALLGGGLEYATDLFDEATAQRILACFETLLAGMVAHPERPLAYLPLMPEAERRQVLVEWNQTGEAPAAGRCLHELFEAQVARTPGATAIVDGVARLSYGDLDDLASRLARHLQGLGVGPEVRVGICLERSAGMVAAMLAVLKAGGAYVGLDPRYPEDRVAFMLADAEALVVLTEASILARLPRLPELAATAQVVRLDEWSASPDAAGVGDIASAGRERAGAPAPRAGDWQRGTRAHEGAAAGRRCPRPLPGNLAYLIYTSGSTGRPKGVAIEHASAAAMVGWARDAFPAATLGGVLAATSICFDLSVFEIFVPLSWGGTVIVAENALALPGLPAAAEVTLVNTVPSAIAGLVRTGGLPAHAATINLAGEALQRELVEEIYRQPGVREVRNLYGPSEDTTYSTWTAVPAGSPLPPAIGRPLTGTRVYLLDAHLEAVPPGVPGELYLAGAGLARGYLGRPDLTADRFVPDPFAAKPGERLYRTGDLARYRADRDLDYLGRIDHQVKVRGFRIELGEIESALAAHPAVAMAAVLVREEAAGDRGLAGYVEPRPGAGDAAALIATLRRDLARHLPDYMVPGRFAVLARLPLTPNGKVDRKALAALAPEDGEIATGATGAAAAGVAPRTPTEELLAGLWAQLLGRPRVGVEDNFFALGGHSLLVTRLVARVGETFGVALPLRRLFEAPTVAGQALLIEAALSHVAELAPPIGPAPAGVPLPLSFSQERLWFIEQFEPGRSAYNLPTAMRCAGTLDVALLAAALNEVVRRHGALRTTFALAGGQPAQVVAPRLAIPVPVVDLSALPDALATPLAERLVTRFAWRPFDLAAGPLLRAMVLRQGPREHVLLLNMHHIVSDGWSMEVLIREVGVLYRAFWEGLPSPLPALAIQYADYSYWQRRWLSGDVLAAQLGYWRQRLAELPPVLDLPIDLPRPAVHTWNGTRISRPLPQELGAGLARLAREGQATLFMTVLAAWNGLLGRWTGQSDFAVGTPVAGRDRAETQGLIGFFVNTLVLRADLSGRPGFTDLVARVRETALGAYAHQDVPFERLLDELAVERSLEHTPLFQVMAIVQQAMGTPVEAGSGGAGREMALPGLVLSPMAYENRTAKFDLTLLFDPNPEAPRAILGFNTDLFLPATIVRLLAHLDALLTAVIADPARPLAEITLLSAAERHQLLVGWNDTPAAEIPATSFADPCLHELFEGWAARQPGAVAAVLDAGVLTYGDLDRQAGELAARLAALGVGPEVRVGLCLPRSFDLLVALLAVLKAGGAYVPLDPANPRDRLLFLLADSRVPVLLTVEALAAELGEPLTALQTTVIRLDDLKAPKTPAAPAAPKSPAPVARPAASGVRADNLAYVIYTSGSTGTPNGVLVPHRAAVNLIREAAGLYQVTERSRVLQTASVGFDASVLEIFLALAHGGSLCLVREEERLTPAVLADRLVAQKVTTGVVTPSLLSVLPEAKLGSLVSISVGGEACPADLAARWAPGRRFLNCYGPTEATIFATVAILRGEEKITIGRPVGRVAAYVVDPEQRPVGLGAVGELVIGGAGLARGYLDRPEKTAAKFIPDPFGTAPGARLYRTGDLARHTPAGEIEFLGRLDDQVKVRGFRIELGEIETAILRHPGLQAAVVLAPADAGGDRRLVAYAAGPAAGRPSAAELRDFLAEHLPEYMVPASLVLLDALPTTPGGKLDRRALRDLDGPNAQERPATGERVAPRTAAERFVAGVWRQVLGVSEIGIDDDFFALGGNSIKGAILTNLLQEQLGEYVYVVALFDAPTLGALARYLEENYTEAIERVTGEPVSIQKAADDRVNRPMIDILREIIPPLAPYASGSVAPEPATGEAAGAQSKAHTKEPLGGPPSQHRAAKNRRAVFILSPPRSGSTLLRVMLAGNPGLFAPPELELLGFNTLAERQEALSGRWALWQEGTLRALMDIYSCDADEARRRMDDAVARGLSVRQFYAELQAAVGDRLLVDKTPSYALDAATLDRAEEDFAAPLYIHLLRHPYGMIRSFEKAKLEQVFFRPAHPFSRRQLAELIWDVSQENILALLARVPAERHIQLRFEEMVRFPEREMRRLCDFLGVPFAPGMLDPYAEKEQRMTDGIHQLSKMVGDVKFHEHKGIEAQVAESWRREIEEDFLGDVTWDLAASLGYEERLAKPERSAGSPGQPRATGKAGGFSPLVPIQPKGSRPPLFLVHPVGGNVVCYQELARHLGEDQPVYGLQSSGLAGGAPEETVEGMAATYNAAIRALRPNGPYRLGGWSVGGAIAFEMACQLRRAGEDVERLFLLDSLTPVRARQGTPAAGGEEIADSLLLAGLARDLAGLSGQSFSVDPAELAGLDPEAGLARVIAAARQAAALPAGVSEEQIGRLWRVYRANVRAVRAYLPAPYPGAAALYVTAHNPERRRLGATLGWERLVRGGLASWGILADHYSLLRDPAVRELAERLSAQLGASTPTSS